MQKASTLITECKRGPEDTFTVNLASEELWH